MGLTKFAPICIPTLCRFEHFKKCVESLSRCTNAIYTDLFIALDMPLKDSHIYGYAKISEYVSSIKGFKNVFIIRREINLGAVKNSQEIMLSVFEHYDRLIFTEDDNEFSPNFLDYINKGLDKYENIDDVFGICGYHFPYPIKSYEKNVYASHAISGWGMGFWRNKYIPVAKQVYNFYYINNILYSKKLSKELYKKNFSIYNDFVSQKTKNILCEDVLISAYLLYNNKYCIFPTVSKVRNWGQDGSGVHSGDLGKNELIYTNQEIDKNLYFNFDNIEIYEVYEVRKMIMRTKQRPFYIRVAIWLRYLCYLAFKKDVFSFYFSKK